MLWIILAVLLQTISNHKVLVASWGHAPPAIIKPLLRATSTISHADTPTKAHSSFDPNCPAQWENQLLQCDSSVHFWSSFQGSSIDPWENLAVARSILARRLVGGSSSAQSSYWTSNVLRSLYFITNAALSVLDQKIRPRQENGTSFLNGIPLASQTRLILEAVWCYEQEWPWIEQGVVAYPWDALVQPSHWQWDHRHAQPGFLWKQTLRAVQESRAILQRRDTWRGQPSRPPSSFDLPNATEYPVSYPEYYLNDFHYQTDGWLSPESAEGYEVFTETLFWGRQDCMQRQTIVPMTAWFQHHAPESILEVACGTGRLSTFVREQFPTARITLTDLSPFYLEKARDNDDYWRLYRDRRHGRAGTDGDVPVSPAEIVQANAEQLPFPDESFAVVFSVYLFHELPPEAQMNAAREMVRVLQPGGVICLTDSLQLGDRPSMDQRMTAFSQLNEPHFPQYIRTNLPQLFLEDENMSCYRKYVRSNTKTISFVKRKQSIGVED
jgi:ubiquinone/menaquinone biosynthesis C-methylase UbiE